MIPFSLAFLNIKGCREGGMVVYVLDGSVREAFVFDNGNGENQWVVERFVSLGTSDVSCLCS
jgi:hypothetical protein